MRTTAITPVASLSVCAIVRFLRVLNRINRSFSFFLFFSSLLSIIFPGKSLSILNPNDVEKNVSFSQFYNSC